MMRWSDTKGRERSAVVVNSTSQSELLNDLETRLGRDDGFNIATLNLDHVVKLRKDPDFRAAYLSHSHVTADGNPIVWLSRLAGDEVELVPGSELIAPVAAMAARLDIPVALFGSTTASLNTAAAALQDRYPGLQIAEAISPPMGFAPTGQMADECADRLAASGARICFLALGAPKQEIFAAHALARHPHMGFLSIGAGLDYISGTQVRAPRLVRRFAGEWLWRLLSNPRRLAWRYVACLAVLPRMLTRALAARLSARFSGERAA